MSQQSTTVSVYEMMDDDMAQEHPRLAGLSAVNLDERCVSARTHAASPPSPATLAEKKESRERRETKTDVRILSWHYTP